MSVSENNSKNTASGPKRIAALLAIVFLVLLYVILLVAAIFDPTAGGKFFLIALFGTIAVPVVLWLYLWMYARFTGTKAIGDPQTPQIPEPEEGTSETEDGSEN
jgi:Zn-dependent protease with chaperone function